MLIKKEEKGHLVSSLEYCQFIAQQRLCSTWNAIWKIDIASVALIKLNDIFVRQSGRLHNLLDQWKNYFEATYSYYHASYVSRKLPPARKKVRLQPTPLPPSPKLGKVSELTGSLLVTSEFCGVSPMILYSVGTPSSTRTQERLCLKKRCRTCIASVEALFFVQLQSVTLLLYLGLSQQHTLREKWKIWCGFRPDVLSLTELHITDVFWGNNWV